MEKGIEDTLEYLREENRALREKQEAAITRAKEKHARRKGNYFTRVIHKTCQKLIRDKVLTTAEQAVLFCILPFLQHQTNMVVNEDKTTMNLKQLAELTGFTPQYIRKIIQQLHGKGILCIEKYGRQVCLRLTPGYFINGENNKL